MGTSEVLRWALAALATWRLAQFVVHDDGPFDVLFRLRRWLGRYELDDEGMAVSGVGRFLSCPHCWGKWLGLGLAALCLWPSWWGDLVIGAWALAGAQSVLDAKWSKRLRG